MPALLAPQLRQALLRLSRTERAKGVAARGLKALAGFAKALKVTYKDIEVGLDFDLEPGLADNGDLEHDLSASLLQAGDAAKAAQSVLGIFVDELPLQRRRSRCPACRQPPQQPSRLWTRASFACASTG